MADHITNIAYCRLPCSGLGSTSTALGHSGAAHRREMANGLIHDDGNQEKSEIEKVRSFHQKSIPEAENFTCYSSLLGQYTIKFVANVA